MVSNLDNNILGYTYTKLDGTYNFVVTSNKEKTLLISASSLGYKKRTDTIYIKKDKFNYNFNFVLEEKIEQLNEVILNPSEKIKKEGNVITYKVSAFKDNTEQTVEDILSKIPGIEVLKNGRIKAHGKYIDKLLIEGDDMFDQNYTMLSKNLDAKTLSNVEIIDGFEDNPLFKKILSSNKIAVNLKLKNQYKNIWFGNLNLGLGSENRLLAGSNIGLIRKDIKFFNLNNYSNIGLRASEQINSEFNTRSNNLFDIKREDLKSNPIYNIETNTSSKFKDNEDVFNKGFINSTSFVKNIKSTKTRGTFFYTNDVEEQFNTSKTTYNINETPIFNSEEKKINLKNKTFGGDLELKINTSKNTPQNIDNNINFNTSSISESAKNKNVSLFNHFNHTILLKNKKLIHSYIYFGKSNNTQNVNIKSPLLNTLFSQLENDLINYNYSNKSTVYGNRHTINFKIGKLKLNTSLSFENLKEAKNNTLTNSNNTTTDSLQNHLVFKTNKYSLSSNLEYKVSNKIEFYGDLSFNYLNTTINQNLDNNIFINPKIGLRLKNLKVGQLSFQYSRDYNSLNSNNFFNNYQLSNYQSFKKGTQLINYTRRNKFRFSYTKGNNLKTKLLSLSINYIESDGKYSNRSIINQNFIYSETLFINGGKRFINKIDFTSYFKKINLSTKIGVLNIINNNPVIVNSNGIQNLKSNTYNYYINGRTYFKLPINFNFNFSHNQNSSDYNNIITKNNWQDLNINTTIKFSKALIASLNSSLYLLEKDTYRFVNFKMDYNPKDSRFSYQFKLNNLLNQNTFSIINISEYSRYQFTSQLLPRYVFSSIKYRI